MPVTVTNLRPLFRTDLPRWQNLVAPAWLVALLAGRAVQAAPPHTWRLFEVDDGAPNAFLRGHIPEAGYIDTNWLEKLPLWNALPESALQAVLLRLGVAVDITVVLYGRHTAAASRAAHLMLVAGVRDVRLLDGGWSAWHRAGLPFATGAPRTCQAVKGGGARFAACPQYLVHTSDVRDCLQRPNVCLVSIRTWDEFIGRTSGYSYIAARGEIPGAVWGHAGEDDDMNSVSAFQDEHGRMRPAREILGFWRAAGIVPERQTVFYCGTGWRASAAFFYAWLMGWEQISVYDGGWFEWSSDPANPTVTHGTGLPAARLSLPA